jgi:hypothetical protein
LTFEQLLHTTAEKGGMVNTLFEERLFALVGVLERIAGPAGSIPYELIGGMAVMVQVQRADPSEVRLTKDVIHVRMSNESKKWLRDMGSVAVPRVWICSCHMEKQKQGMVFTSSSAARGQPHTGRTESAVKTGAYFRARHRDQR